MRITATPCFRTGETATAEPVVIGGFTHNASAPDTVKTGVITGDGKLVLKLYYDRNEYKVTYKYEGDLPERTPDLPSENTHAYGTEVTVADRVEPPAGYEFVGWYMGTNDNIVTEFEMPARDVELLGYFKPSTGVPYTIHHYLETLEDGVYDEANPVLVESDFRGVTGHTVTATPLDRFTGFTLSYLH